MTPEQQSVVSMSACSTFPEHSTLPPGTHHAISPRPTSSTSFWQLFEVNDQDDGLYTALG